MMLNEAMIIQIIMGALGALSFEIWFNVRGVNLWLGVVGGALGWLVYLVTGGVYPNDLVNYLYAAMAVTLYAEILARMRKEPVTVFLVSSIIPLIPGGSLYYTMQYAILGDGAAFSARGAYTIAIAAMIALGIMAVMMVVRVYTSLIAMRRVARHKQDGRC